VHASISLVPLPLFPYVKNFNGSDDDFTAPPSRDKFPPPPFQVLIATEA